MKRGEQYIEPDNSYYRPSRDPNEGTMTLVVVITLLFVCMTGVLAAVYFKKVTTKETLANIDVTDQSGYISIASPTPTPIPPIADYQNPILYPGLANVRIDKDLPIATDANPAARGINQTVMKNRQIVEGDYSREKPIYMKDPVFYGSIPGIFTYRGNNFRNCASYGYTNVYRGALTQRWEFNGVGTKLASTLNFEWGGVRWTGQPLVAEWPIEVRRNMNLNDMAKNQQVLREVIVAALDGKIYFFNILNGEKTRDPINVGASIKGTPALDPRGYPLLYIGAGYDSARGCARAFVISLIDFSVLHEFGNYDPFSLRGELCYFDGSALVDAETDTLIYPGENGIVYIIKLNTQYDEAAGTISIEPETVKWHYYGTRTTLYQYWVGMEDSAVIWRGHLIIADNGGRLMCLDLNTLELDWVQDILGLMIIPVVDAVLLLDLDLDGGSVDVEAEGEEDVAAFHPVVPCGEVDEGVSGGVSEVEGTGGVPGRVVDAENGLVGFGIEAVDLFGFPHLLPFFLNFCAVVCHVKRALVLLLIYYI